MTDLTGRRSVVTGAASGIGRAIAEDLASHGARVLLADLNEADAAELAARLPGTLSQRVDIASRDDCRALIERAPAAIKRLLEPSEVAAYVTFPCSEQAASITGSAQVIDCGWTAR